MTFLKIVTQIGLDNGNIITGLRFLI
jgi:hypothetical protein